VAAEFNVEQKEMVT